VKESGKSINFSQSYRHEYGVLFFMTHIVYAFYTEKAAF